MRGVMAPTMRHWSQIAVGDVVLVTRSIWMQVSGIEHRRQGRLTLLGRDLRGDRRGQEITRSIPMDRLYLVEQSGAPRLVWVRSSSGVWSALHHELNPREPVAGKTIKGRYELQREGPGRSKWRMIRNGETWDAVHSLRWAKQLCERDAAKCAPSALETVEAMFP